MYDSREYKGALLRVLAPTYAAPRYPTDCREVAHLFDIQSQGKEGFNDWGGRGYDDFVPGRSPKQPLPGMELHHPLHGRQACPEFIVFDQGVSQICPRQGLFSCRSLPKGDKFVTSPPPPPIVKRLERHTFCSPFRSPHALYRIVQLFRILILYRN